MSLPEGLPERTLGWGVLNWGSQNLAHPDVNFPDKGWVYTPGQARFILWFYAVDENGRFVYRRAVVELAKGTGKSPFGAALCATEMLGPIQFSHWVHPDYPGKKLPIYIPGAKAVGKPRLDALVQVAAISDQQGENAYGPLMHILSTEPKGRPSTEKKFNLDIGLSRVIGPNKRRIERVTASAASREGRQSTFVLADETWLWRPAEHGAELAGVLTGNLAKKRGRQVEMTNCFRPGEQSIAETSHNYVLDVEAGKAAGGGILYYAIRSECDDIYDHDQFIAAAEVAYQDAPWVDLEEIWGWVNDPVNSEGEVRRKFLNQLWYGDNSWINGKKLSTLTTTGAELKWKKQKFALGFRGSVRNGAAALVACRLTDGALFLLSFWEKPERAKQDWEIPYLEVDAAARKWLARMPVKCVMNADPQNWKDIVGRWAVDNEEKVEEYWTNQRNKMARAVNQFEKALYAGRATVRSEDAPLIRHLIQAHREEIPPDPGDPNQDLYVIRPANSKVYIQAAQAAVLAYEAAQLSIEQGALKEEPSNELYSW